MLQILGGFALKSRLGSFLEDDDARRKEQECYCNEGEHEPLIFAVQLFSLQKVCSLFVLFRHLGERLTYSPVERGAGGAAASAGLLEEIFELSFRHGFNREPPLGRRLSDVRTPAQARY
jgi:hypothetical protein